jgi:hypothetical protein
MITVLQLAQLPNIKVPKWIPHIYNNKSVRNADLNGPENVDLEGPAESLINHGTVGPRVWKVYSRRGRKVTTA